MNLWQLVLTELKAIISDKAIAVTLSGMGADGTLGAQAIKAVALTKVNLSSQQPDS